MKNAPPSCFKISGERISFSDSSLHMLRENLQRQKCIHLPGVLDGTILGKIQQENSKAQFQDISNEEIGRELGTLNQGTIRRMNGLVNDEALFNVIKDLCLLPRLGCFTGRIVKMLPSYNLDWHSDFYGSSVVGMSINLSEEVFDGGEFQIRNRSSKEVYFRIKNIGAGDAIIFLLGEDLEHRLTNIEGHRPRLTFAGWFRTDPHFAQPEYQPLLQECLED